MHDIAIKKRTQRDAKQHQCLEQTLNNPNHESVLKTFTATSVDIQEGYTNGSFNCKDVVLAYSWRSSTDGRKLEAIAEEFYDEAFETAEIMDKYATDKDKRDLINAQPLCTPIYC